MLVVDRLDQKLHAGRPGAGLRCRDQLVVSLVAPVTVVVGVTSRFTVQEGDRVSVVGDPAGQGAFKVAGQDPVLEVSSSEAKRVKDNLLRPFSFKPFSKYCLASCLL